jgi:catechol 2,3-dioxygenase-like lactoylglutathione lyase family enzyme
MTVVSPDRPAPLARHMHHVALEVADMDQSIAFYRKFMGMKLTERHPAGENPAIPVELAFLRLHSQHHDLVLAHDPDRAYVARDRKAGPVGIHHYAFECADRQSWLGLLDRATEMGLKIVRGPVLHSASQPGGDGSWGETESFYVLDPDGHRIELFCEMGFVDQNGQFETVQHEKIADSFADEV